MYFRGTIIGLAILIFLVAVFAVIGGQSNRINDLHNQIVVCEQKAKVSLSAAHDEAEDMKETLDMATEFHFDPAIVFIVRKYAKDSYSKDNVAWRFIPSANYAAYLMCSMIYVESKGIPDTVGDHGKAVGLTQIWLSTANDYEKISKEDLLDPDNNIRISFMHFQKLLEKYNGNFALALYAWNRGSSKVDKLIRYGEPVENDYGAKIYRAALNVQSTR